MTNDEIRKNAKARISNGWIGARVVHGWTWRPRNALEGIANESSCLPTGKRSSHAPVSRRDILKIARRFNAGNQPGWHTSPEGTVEKVAAGRCLEQIVAFKSVHGTEQLTSVCLRATQHTGNRDSGRTNICFPMSSGMPVSYTHLTLPTILRV